MIKLKFSLDRITKRTKKKTIKKSLVNFFTNKNNIFPKGTLPARGKFLKTCKRQVYDRHNWHDNVPLERKITRFLFRTGLWNSFFCTNSLKNMIGFYQKLLLITWNSPGTSKSKSATLFTLDFSIKPSFFLNRIYLTTLLVI